MRQHQTVKVFLLGDARHGKTTTKEVMVSSVLSRAWVGMKGGYRSTEQLSVKEVHLNPTLTAELWDFPGQPEFHHLHQLFWQCNRQSLFIILAAENAITSKADGGNGVPSKWEECALRWLLLLYHKSTSSQANTVDKPAVVLIVNVFPNGERDPPTMDDVDEFLLEYKDQFEPVLGVIRPLLVALEPKVRKVLRGLGVEEVSATITRICVERVKQAVESGPLAHTDMMTTIARLQNSPKLIYRFDEFTEEVAKDAVFATTPETVVEAILHHHECLNLQVLKQSRSEKLQIGETPSILVKLTHLMKHAVAPLVDAEALDKVLNTKFLKTKGWDRAKDIKAVRDHKGQISSEIIIRFFRATDPTMPIQEAFTALRILDAIVPIPEMTKYLCPSMLPREAPVLNQWRLLNGEHAQWGWPDPDTDAPSLNTVGLGREMHICGTKGVGSIVPPGMLSRIQAMILRLVDSGSLLWRKGAYVMSVFGEPPHQCIAYGRIVELDGETHGTHDNLIKLLPALLVHVVARGPSNMSAATSLLNLLCRVVGDVVDEDWPGLTRSGTEKEQHAVWFAVPPEVARTRNPELSSCSHRIGATPNEIGDECPVCGSGCDCCGRRALINTQFGGKEFYLDRGQKCLIHDALFGYGTFAPSPDRSDVVFKVISGVDADEDVMCLVKVTVRDHLRNEIHLRSQPKPSLYAQYRNDEGLLLREVIPPVAETTLLQYVRTLSFHVGASGVCDVRLLIGTLELGRFAVTGRLMDLDVDQEKALEGARRQVSSSTTPTLLIRLVDTPEMDAIRKQMIALQTLVSTLGTDMKTMLDQVSEPVTVTDVDRYSRAMVWHTRFGLWGPGEAKTALAALQASDAVYKTYDKMELPKNEATGRVLAALDHWDLTTDSIAIIRTDPTFLSGSIATWGIRKLVDCFVGKDMIAVAAVIRHGPVAYIAIRGSKTSADWTADAAGAMPRTDELTGDKVHAGFSAYAVALAEAIRVDHDAQRLLAGVERYVLCGHSLGGATAALLYHQLLGAGLGGGHVTSLKELFLLLRGERAPSSVNHLPPVQVHTFGAPLIGDAGFQIRAVELSQVHCWVVPEDPVPRLLQWAGYGPMGLLHILGRDGLVQSFEDLSQQCAHLTLYELNAFDDLKSSLSQTSSGIASTVAGAAAAGPTSGLSGGLSIKGTLDMGVGVVSPVCQLTLKQLRSGISLSNAWRLVDLALHGLAHKTEGYRSRLEDLPKKIEEEIEWIGRGGE